MKTIRYILLAVGLMMLLTFPFWQSGWSDSRLGALDSGPDPQTPLNLYVDGTAAANGQNGSQTHPFTTIAAARDHIRELQRPLPQGGITVWIKGGEYTLSSTLEWSAADSGTATAPIIYRSFSGEKVSLTNGKTVNPADWQPLDAAARSRVNPAIQPDQLVELDVRKLGFHHINGFAGGDSFTEQWGILQLIVDDTMQPISQWPNRDDASAGTRPGWAVAAGILNARSFFYDPAQNKDAGIEGRMQRWEQAIKSGHDVYLQGFWRTVWSPVTIRLQRIEASSRSIQLSKTPNGGIGSKFSAMADHATDHNPYRIGDGSEEWRLLNLLEEIDQPGEWALDFKDGKLYYYPAHPLNQSQTVIADNTDPIIRINGTSYMKLIGLELKNGMGNGMTMQNTNHMTIAGLTIRNMSNGGITDIGGSHNMIQSNDIYDTGSFGISVSNAGSRAKLISANTRITNNHIYNTGILVHLEPLIIRDSVGMRMDHNLLHDVPKDAVRYTFSNKLLFEYNEVHNTGLVEGDTGAFYTAQDWSSYGNVLRYNLIHHNRRSNGFYADGGSSGNTYQNNIVQDTKRAFIIENGHHNVATGNLLINTGTMEINDRSSTLNYGLNSEYANRLRSLKPMSGAWKTYGEQLAKQYGLSGNLWSHVLNAAWQPQYPNGSKLNNNVIVGSITVRLPKKGDATATGNVTIKTIQAAGFYNYSNLDLRTNNSVILKKFPSLNRVITEIGLYSDRYRVQPLKRNEYDALTNHTSH
ncbi:right-handed parallel beta-helix repeat-containing protein [Paenibacillus campi]|uniref:right-handed parallel beta-helix repeat-containing protein n=1 Tax=Paenibacillus campi TaxID=3106031 RepID=UPI002AFDD5D0|nr:right-handed parallel beta-helix repeat-containing protein [Paenibacillus sp. SGZ-1009]